MHDSINIVVVVVRAQREQGFRQATGQTRSNYARARARPETFNSRCSRFARNDDEEFWPDFNRNNQSEAKAADPRLLSKTMSTCLLSHHS